MAKPRKAHRISALSVIQAAGGPAALARALASVAAERGKTITEQAISNWGRRDIVSPYYVHHVARITGIPAHLIRPDLVPPPRNSDAA